LELRRKTPAVLALPVGPAKVAGLTPVQYVSNIYKYYISYQLADERLEADRKAREDMGAEK
jgi:hypothetical protein